MKKLFTILGVIFAVIVVIFIIIAAIFIPSVIKRDHEAVSYIEDAVPKIVTNWNSQELIDRATPELLTVAKKNDGLDRLFAMFRQLGSFKHLDQPEGTVMSSAYTGTGTVTIGNYKAHAQFEKGEARIEIQLRRVGDSWQINGFRIFSDAFLPPKT